MKKKKVALIYGVTGQDGAYLTRLLLKKNYTVHGIKRRTSIINTSRLDEIYIDPHYKSNFYLHYGDLTDPLSISNHISLLKPDEIYNLGAQSHVGVSFQIPEYTANVDGLGTLRILEAIRNLKLTNKIKYYQAGTSEMFGSTKPPQRESSIFAPQSPYAAAKLYAHWITINYRQSYGMFACNGILFNHESPLRGETFVTQKIVKGLLNILRKKQSTLFLGNLNAKRDWGHAEDYVLGMWKILQQKKPDDYVLATGKQYSVREFINLTAKELNMDIKWKGTGLKECGFCNGKIIIRIDKRYFRPAEVETLLGDSIKARKKLNWKPKYGIKEIIKEMIAIENSKYD